MIIRFGYDFGELRFLRNIKDTMRMKGKIKVRWFVLILVILYDSTNEINIIS